MPRRDSKSLCSFSSSVRKRKRYKCNRTPPPKARPKLSSTLRPTVTSSRSRMRYWLAEGSGEVSDGELRFIEPLIAIHHSSGEISSPRTGAME